MGIDHLKFTIVFMIAFTSLQNFVVRFFTDVVVKILHALDSTAPQENTTHNKYFTFLTLRIWSIQCKLGRRMNNFWSKLRAWSLKCVTVPYTFNDNNAVVVCRFRRRRMRWLSVNSIDCLKPRHSFHINWTLTTCTVNQFHWDMPWSLSSSMFLLLFYFVLLASPITW